MMNETGVNPSVQTDGQRTIAFQTFGCKVNQYDTQAMRERFLAEGYQEVPIDAPADVYLINTCTVTGTGDRKSLNAIRRCHKINPAADIIVTGCLSQREPEKIGEMDGVRLVLGTQNRSSVVSLLHQAIAGHETILSVSSKIERTFENLPVQANEGHTRAVLKIQEGCNRFCTYCIIPFVRGPIRSRPADQIREEAAVLAQNGYREIVLTGIHLTSYGLDLKDGTTLLDAIDAVSSANGIERIRLGSLEPVIITETFVSALKKYPKVCLQFHLALQSGSNPILERMHRRYTKESFLAACDLLRTCFPECAITTDVMCGFPGETEELFLETCETCRRAGFTRMHVFPYSEREGTPAAVMDGCVPVAERQARARRLIALGETLKNEASARMIGRNEKVLVETEQKGALVGYTDTYFRCIIDENISAGSDWTGKMAEVRITGVSSDTLTACLVSEN
ncbi:MAG: tRNA (N(6)-L-threonylcarbamoyladenosine(37)-C(2))-methylthiotransferase MtaB [Clostridia bacterium]|nr:tRNA (N(6)-L-threonylcarbamoyladenosine(37)-C(2))-methylthiotransferase MtaB [Clostridia bacterium]